MNILAIETSTEFCSVAMYYKGTIKQEMRMERNGHSRHILSMVKILHQKCGAQLADMDVIAVDIGPGSFTGVRIGLGVAQGLSYGADIPVIGVQSLEVLAVNINTEDTLVLPALDARMGQVYFALYASYASGSSSRIRQIIPPTVDDPGSINIRTAQKAVVGLGSGWDQYSKKIINSLNGYDVQWQPECYPDAISVVCLANQYGMDNTVSGLDIRASYIRNQVTHIDKFECNKLSVS